MSAQCATRLDSCTEPSYPKRPPAASGPAPGAGVDMCVEGVAWMRSGSTAVA